MMRAPLPLGPLLHVHHQFHSVGHGTFLTGAAVGESENAIRWAYDCGSKRSTRIRDAITALSTLPHWPLGAELDLLTISHFDDDHVNGLEQLLDEHYVRHLALPYMSFRQRLAHAASLGGDESASAATARLSIDPIGFLEERGLLDRVGSILVIRGGEGGASDAPPTPPVPDDPDGSAGQRNARDENVGRRREVPQLLMLDDPSGDGASIQYRRGTSSKGLSPVLKMLGHAMPLTFAGIPLEFTFFNTALLEPATTNRSKLPISAVQDEVEGILARYCLLSPRQRPKRGWRNQLKACYTRHFGNSGSERNDISLCLMVRPMSVDAPERCELFGEVCDAATGKAVSNIAVDCEGQSLLLTGDLTLNKSVISAMQSHFRPWRWDRLSVVQIPHHGSRHSWAYGNAALFPAPHFVHCVPTPPRNWLHPHDDVVHDLVGQSASEATYDRPVVHSYHFRA